MGASKAVVVKKKWGHELVFASNLDYCGKILQFDRSGGQCSMHFHLEKDESWLCLDGSFQIDILNTETAERGMVSLKPGDTWHNAPGEPHRITCLEPGRILEVSTRDRAADNYRIEPGDSQK